MQVLCGCCEFLFKGGQLAVADFGHLSVFAGAFSLFGFKAQLFHALFGALQAFYSLFFRIPLGRKLGPLLRQLRQLLFQHREALLVFFALDGLLLNLELGNLAVQIIQFLRLGIDLQTQLRRRLVHQVNGLVGEEAVRDVALAEQDALNHRLVFDADLVVAFVLLLDAAQNADGGVRIRFFHHHLLEATFQGLVLLEVFLEFG